MFLKINKSFALTSFKKPYHTISANKVYNYLCA
mgnify:CR=1 FL=1